MKTYAGLLLVLSLLSSLQQEKIRVFLVGDSTMSDKEIRAYPETGWGMPFEHFFDEGVVVDNRARNGRSTKSFISEQRWAAVMDSLKAGDYVFIQFGHNDEVPTKKTYTTEDQFVANLVRFVADTRSKGAFPVLLTPVARRKFDSAGRVEETHAMYADLVRKVAAEQKVPLIDLDQHSQELLQAFGPENSRMLYNYLTPGEHPNYPQGKQDDTHFSELGARKMAELVLAGVRSLGLGLADHIYKVPAAGKTAAVDAPAIRVQAVDSPMIDPEPFADNTHHWYDIYDRKADIHPVPGQPRYRPTEVAAIADNIVLLQRYNGGWPKNYDVFAILSSQQKESLMEARRETNTTFDNGSTFTEVAALAIAWSVTKADKYRTAALKGLDFILDAQYKNGGWPQFYPLEQDYSRCITYNDGVMEGIMRLLKDIREQSPRYDFVDEGRRKKLSAAYDRGLACILATQINDAGQPTAWCQQYDESRLRPAWARKFEPPSICNKESAGIVLFLMSIEHPGQPVIDAIQNAVAWFRTSEIFYTREETIAATPMQTPYRISTTDKVVVTDSAAPPVWTRYYELKSHRPIFCDRDSKIVYSLAEVSRERRDGYGWYTYDPQHVLDAYPAWQNKIAVDKK